MMGILDVLVTVVTWLFQASLKATLVIALIFAIQIMFRKKLSAKWMHALWLLLIIRLIIPFDIPSPFSLFNYTEEISTAYMPPMSDYREEMRFDYATQPPRQIGPVQTSDPIIISEPTTLFTNLDFIDYVSLAWFLITIALLVYTFILNRKITKTVTHGQNITDSTILTILARCKKSLNIKQSIQVVGSAQTSTPFWYGIIRKRIVIPQEIIDENDSTKIEHIIMHELAHFKQKDIFIALVSTLLQILHWFNPFVWLAFMKMRADREVACDELVLTNIGTHKNIEYGRTLISLVESASQRGLLPVAVGLADSKLNLKRRVTMISTFSKKSMWWSVLAILLFTVIAALALTGAQEDYNVKAKINFAGQAKPDSVNVGIYPLNQSNYKNIRMGTPISLKSSKGETNFKLKPGAYSMAAWSWGYDAVYTNFLILDDKTNISFDITLDEKTIAPNFKTVKVCGDFNNWENQSAINMQKNGNVWVLTPPQEIQIDTHYKFLLETDEFDIDGKRPKTFYTYSPAIKSGEISIEYASYDHIFDGSKEIVFDPSLYKTTKSKARIEVDGLGIEKELTQLYSFMNPISQKMFDHLFNKKDMSESIYQNTRAQFDSLKKASHPLLIPAIEETAFYTLIHSHPFNTERRRAHKKIIGTDSTLYWAAFEGENFKNFINYAKETVDNIDMTSFLFTGSSLCSDLRFVSIHYDMAPAHIKKELGLDANYFLKPMEEFIAGPTYPGKEGVLKSMINNTIYYIADDASHREKARKLIEQLEKEFPNSWYLKDDISFMHRRMLQYNLGETAPDFSVTTLDGKNFKLSDQKGKFVFLDFWGTWCEPCKRETPNMIKMAASISSDSLIILGLAKDSKSAVKKYIKEQKLNYPNAVLVDSTANLFGINSYPTTLLISPDGKIYAKHYRGPLLTNLIRQRMKTFYSKKDS